jgi:hypothetical protein
LERSQKSKFEADLEGFAARVARASSLFIPSTMTDWANGPPPAQSRLPIDDELMLLARRKRRPVIRSDSAILAEFLSLDWDGPYRAARFFLFYFYILRHDWDSDSAYRRKVFKQAEVHIDLLSDIRKFMRIYLDEIKSDPHAIYVLAVAKDGSRLKEWIKDFRSLRTAVTKVGRLEKFTEEAVRDEKKNGRPPNYSKSHFVTGLANLWRIMTGDDASKDLAGPFASFISAAWASLDKDLPEISWASQIRRRKDTLSAAELVRWVDQIREFPVKQFHLARKGLRPVWITWKTPG